jgi:hypothetical protein
MGGMVTDRNPPAVAEFFRENAEFIANTTQEA